jgi:hypothetical protein
MTLRMSYPYVATFVHKVIMASTVSISGCPGSQSWTLKADDRINSNSSAWTTPEMWQHFFCFRSSCEELRCRQVCFTLEHKSASQCCSTFVRTLRRDGMWWKECKGKKDSEIFNILCEWRYSSVSFSEYRLYEIPSLPIRSAVVKAVSMKACLCVHTSSKMKCVSLYWHVSFRMTVPTFSRYVISFLCIAMWLKHIF